MFTPRHVLRRECRVVSVRLRALGPWRSTAAHRIMNRGGCPWTLSTVTTIRTLSSRDSPCIAEENEDLWWDGKRLTDGPPRNSAARLLAAVLAAIAGTLLMFLGLVAALHEITDVDLTGAGPQPDSDLTTIAVVLLGAGLGFVFLALWALVGRQVRGSRRPVRKCRRSRACDT